MRVDPDLTRAQLKAVIPDHCFRPQTGRSLAYLVFDWIVIGLLYAALAHVSVWYLQAPLIFLIGTMLWAVFVIGHEAGHGAVSPSRTVNTLVGLITHVPLLVPYRGWQRSHALHHGKTGHLHREEVFRAARREQNNLFRKIIYRSGIFLLIGWPIYLIGFRNVGTYEPIKGSHYLPQSDLYASHLKWSWAASALGVFLFLAAYLSIGLFFSWGSFIKFVLLPYIVFITWLTFVTWTQHVSERVPVYDTEDWTPLKGALATMDLDFGPFDWLTHRVGSTHVLHHLFPTIPHYYASEATEAIKPLLGDTYLKSDRFVVWEFLRSLIECHHVVPADGYEVYKSDYKFAKNTEAPINRAGQYPAE